MVYLATAISVPVGSAASWLQQGRVKFGDRFPRAEVVDYDDEDGPDDGGVLR